jgi:hypothetical protein
MMLKAAQLELETLCLISSQPIKTKSGGFW